MSDYRYCYVNCGLPADKCACHKRMLDPMPRVDVTLPPSYSLDAVAMQGRIAALEVEFAATLARAERAEALLKEAVEALNDWQSAGCPYCQGDCASANPPMSWCIMETTRAILARILATLEEVSDE